MKIPIQKVYIGINFLTFPKQVKSIIKKIKDIKRKHDK